MTKKNKVLVKKYLLLVTNYSDSQIGKLIRRYKKYAKILQIYPKNKNKFKTKYSKEDILLLIKTDLAHSRLSGEVTKNILVREFNTYGRVAYDNISKISISYIYDIRKKDCYKSRTSFFNKTKNTPSPIGERKKPQPDKKAGYLRVDTVHQGDNEKEKGVYYINMVDEVTQWQMVFCVPQISDEFMIPVLERINKNYPFKIINFHSDNGSEFINKKVSKLLNRLNIHQTKSRARLSNDNALVESKNKSTVRKNFGYNFIDKSNAKIINDFCSDYLNIYINYHKPCGYATNHIDKKGKIKKKYETYSTPFVKLKTLENLASFLKDDIKLEDLEKIEMTKSDNEFAEDLCKAKEILFKKIQNKTHLEDFLI